MPSANLKQLEIIKSGKLPLNNYENSMSVVTFCYPEIYFSVFPRRTYICPYVCLYVCMYVYTNTNINTCICTNRCAAWTWTETWTCSMDMKHGHGHASWTWRWTSTMDMEINKHHGCRNADKSLVWHRLSSVSLQHLVRHRHSSIVVNPVPLITDYSISAQLCWKGKLNEIFFLCFISHQNKHS